MRVVGRYFAIGGALGSVSGLVVLVLIWTWMTVHLGLLGFLVGWVPAGLAAAAVWLVMVVFWGPVLIVGAMISLALLLLGVRGGHHRDWDEAPAAREPEEAPAPPVTEAPRDAAAPTPQERPEEPPALLAPPPTPGPPAPPGAGEPSSGPATQPSVQPRALSAPSPRARPSDDLGGDAAAAGDTSRPRPRQR